MTYIKKKALMPVDKGKASKYNVLVFEPEPIIAHGRMKRMSRIREGGNR